MKKYFSLVSVWTLVFILTLVFSSASLTEADPTDDFSFTLGYFPRVELYHFMSEERVTEILIDRLDLFPRSLAPRLARHIIAECKRFRLDPAFILSLIRVESEFKIRAVSQVGALGLMQMMIPTANFVIRQLGIHYSGQENFQGTHLGEGPITPSQLMDPFVNTAIGIAYLAWLRDYYQGMPSHYVLAAYNVGPARMDELLAQKSFQPVETKKYFLAIRKGVPEFRFYKRDKQRISRRPVKSLEREAHSFIDRI